MSTWREDAGWAAGEPRAVGEYLAAAVDSLGGAPAGVLVAVFEGWEALAGPEIAAHARPQSMRDGVLVLVADQPAWASELRFLAADLLARVRQVTGSDYVREVRVGVARDGRL